MTRKIRTYIIIALLLLCQNIMAQNKTPTTDSPSQKTWASSLYHPLSEPCGASSIMKGGTTSSATIPISGGDTGYCRMKFRKNPTLQQADSLLRSDLRELCTLFRKYGRDTLLLAVLAYNVGPYKILGNGKYPKSRLLKKIEQGDRNIRREYLDFADTKNAR